MREVEAQRVRPLLAVELGLAVGTEGESELARIAVHMAGEQAPKGRTRRDKTIPVADCLNAHPEYSRVHPMDYFPGDAEYEKSVEEHVAWARRARARIHERRRRLPRVRRRSRTAGLRVVRSRLEVGFMTASQDGRPLAPLMGAFQEHDGGETSFEISPLSFGVALPDHAVLFRFTPRTPLETDIELTWLVDAAAIENRDYSLDRLTWMWNSTFARDEVMVDDNQRGVSSRFCRPGLYSKKS